MRATIVGLLLVGSSVAHAGRTGGGGGSGGGGGGGGRLGQVSGGIGAATGGQGSRGSSQSQDERTGEGELYRREHRGEEVILVTRDGTIVRRIAPRPEPSGGEGRIDLFVGAQKVYESDGSLTLSLAVEDSWFRLAGSVTRYSESQMTSGPLTLTMPSLMAGIRIDDHQQTRAFLEAGAVGVITRNDPMVDSSLTGPIGGVHVEHGLGRAAVIVDAHAMFFEAGVHAYEARVGLRVGHFEAAVRALDFNVGPALYGPEVGLRF